MANMSTLHQQWAKRTQDESFESVEALHNFCVMKKMQSRQGNVNLSELNVSVNPVYLDSDGEETKSITDTKIESLQINTPHGKSLIPGNYAFSQLCRWIDVPPSLVRGLPPALVADILNHKLAATAKSDVSSENLEAYDLDDINQGRPIARDAKLLWSENGHNILRAVNSTNYGRLWDDTVTGLALELADKYNLFPAPAAFDGKRGLYAAPDGSDVFVCLVDSERKIFESLPGGGLSRGIMMSNSEAGKLVFWICGFGYTYICGNHNIWGFDKQFEIKFRHGKNLQEKIKPQEIQESLTKYLEASPEHEEKLIKQSMDTILGKDKEEVVESIVKLRNPMVGKRFAEKLYDNAEARVDWYGNPRTAWAMGNSLTEYAKAVNFGDRRQAFELAARDIMAIGQ